MTLEVHSVEIRVKDSATPQLKTISTGAKQVGTDLEQSGQKANRAFDGFDRKMAAVGASIATATGILSDWSRAAAEDEAGQARLQQAVENTGKSYGEFAQQIDQAIASGQKKAFSDDQIREALVRLTTTTGDAKVAMQELGLVEDFARARGVDLGTAADLIGKAYEGNTAMLARYGIQLDKNATSEQALAAIQQRVSGQADAFANTKLGWIETEKIKIDELTESWGYHLGAVSKVLALMPGLSAAYSALGGILGGMGGLGTLATVAGPLAILAGGASLGYGYSQDSIGTTGTNSFWNNFFLKGAQVFNTLTPGNIMDTQKYYDQMDQNKAGDIINKYLLGTGMKQEDVWNSIADITGTITGEMSTKDLIQFVIDQAKANYESVEQYLSSQAQAAGYVRDPGSGAYVPKSVYYNNMGGAAKAPIGGGGYTSPIAASGTAVKTLYPGDPGYVGKPGELITYKYSYANVQNDPRYPRVEPQGAGGITPKGSGGITPVGVGDMITPHDTSAADAFTAALGKQYQAYLGIATGANLAASAQEAFKATQDGLIQNEGVYGQQLSEYNGQLNALTGAYDVISQKKQSGIELSKQEQDFLANYDEAYGRLTGGINDATEAQGMLAEQYALNMEKGDQLNQTMGETAGAVGDLVTVIQDLILSMDGVPPVVKSEILLERADSAAAALEAVVNYLNALDGRTVTFYVNAAGNGVAVGNPNGPSINPGEGYMLGGMIPAARHGRLMSGYTLVGEDGPELLSNRMVIPASATRARTRGGGGGHSFQFNAPITVVANDPRQFGAALSEYAIGAAR